MALYFNRTDQYLTTADDDVLTLPDGDWTIALWAKRTSVAGTGYQYFLSWGAFNVTPSINWLFADATNPVVPNRLGFRLRDNDGTSTGDVYSTGTVGVDTWTHLLIQRSGSTITQYINGVADGSVVNASFDAVNRSDAMNLGRRADGNADRYFGGALAWVAKWGRALPEAQRDALAAGACPCRFPDELSWVAPMRWGIVNEEFWKRSDGGVWTRMSANAYGSPTLVDGPVVEQIELAQSIEEPVIAA